MVLFPEKRISSDISSTFSSVIFRRNIVLIQLYMKNFFVLVLFALFSPFSFAQNETEPAYPVDSIIEAMDEFQKKEDYPNEEESLITEEPETEGQMIRNKVTLRSFDTLQLNKIREDKAFGYLEIPKARKPNILQLLIMKIADWLDKHSGRNRDTERKVQNWMINLLVYGIALFAVGMILWSLFKVKIREIFMKEAEPLEISFTEKEVNIVETNFEVLIQKALQQSDFRGAVRLLYMEALKTLTQNNWIQWKANKTNHEYLMELYNSPFRKSFIELTRSFEYIFYGDFPVNAEVYQNIAGTFKEFQTKVTKKVS